MTMSSPPAEAQRYARSQTPESPRPVHIPEPSNIPVLMNQMDPVFNDTATYNIPNKQTSSPGSDATSTNDPRAEEEHDPIQDFLRGAGVEIEQEEAINTALAAQNPPHQVDNVSAIDDPMDVSTNTLSSLTELPLTRASSNQQILSLPTPSSTIPSEQFEPAAVFPGEGQAASSNIQDPNLMSMEPYIQDAPGDSMATVESGSDKIQDQGVDYQSLLDTISQSTSTAPAAQSLTAPTTAALQHDASANSLPSFPGLPPKPPPRESQPDFQSYPAPSDLQALTESASTENGGSSAFPSHSQSSDPALAQFNTSDPGQNAIAEILRANIPPPQATDSAPGTQLPGQTDVAVSNDSRNLDPNERPWTPKRQALYDQFLEDERRYVTEGIWDKFPAGSRLFVGNLPSEKVTKRDLFHIFHKHGRLAQISIKQAYGFVQFLEALSCYNALTAEQGVEIRGRKIHLEISKPQKNTRGAGQSGNKGAARRRSRSPERGGSRTSNDRHGARPNYSDYRDEPGRRRDDYRPVRSPSPRGYRVREDYRTGGQPYVPPEGRSRSPSYSQKYPHPPPPPPPAAAAFDDEASLPIPRRNPRDVPDVQILILESQVAQSFVNWIEQGFRNKSLRASTMWLSPRLPLPGVVKRQIIEGVQAVVKLSMSNQHNSKIPLQVFDRTAGASNVNFNEYVELDVSVAADIVIHARHKEQPSHQLTIPPTYAQSYHASPQSPYGAVPLPPHFPQQPGANQLGYPVPPQNQPPYPYPPPQQQSHNAYRSQPHTPATPIGNGPPPPNLQELLANLRQPNNPAQASPQSTTPTMNGRPTDLAGLLSNVAARQYNHNPLPNQNMPGPYGGRPGQPPMPNPQQHYGSGSMSGRNQGYGSPPVPMPGQPQPPHQNMQNIMEQLARFQR